MSASGSESGLITVGDYLIERLREYGIDHIFGVPGDFVLRFMSRIEASPITLVNTCDEQGAGFAADAYARMRGLGVVCVTYGVGGLKVTNTTGQAYAEESPVVVISGAPSMTERRRHPLIHHKVRSYDTQFRVFQQLTVASTVLDDPETACREIDRVLGAAWRYKRPVYVELPRDMVDAVVPYCPPPLTQAPEASDPQTLAAALAEATEWINQAERPVIVLGVEVDRFDLDETAMRIVEESGIPVTVSLLDKAAISERHPNFIGVYAGALGRSEVREYVEGSDCLIQLGTLLTDVNLGVFTAQIDPARCIHATRNRLAVGLHTYEQVRLADFVRGLAEADLRKRHVPNHPRPPVLEEIPMLDGAAQEPITIAHLIPRLASILTPETIVLADTGDAMFASIDLPVQEVRSFLAPAFYTAVGFAVPGAIGAQCAKPESRALALLGDGAFQMTGMELSTCVRFGLDPIVVVLNNAGYTTERLILEGAFNDLLPWDFSKVPEVLGAGRARVIETVGDLDAALEEATERDGQFFLLDVRLSELDVSPALVRLGEQLSKTAVGST